MLLPAVIAAIVLALAPASPPSRIVALMPSFTEDVCAIGAANEVIGVSAYSGDIPCARGKPVVGDFASVDAEQILALHANLVLGIPAQARLLLPLQRAGLRVVLLRNDSYADIFSDITQIGELTGKKQNAQKLIERLHAQTADLQRHVGVHKRQPRVFVVLGTGPIYTAGPTSYIATLLSLAGAQDAVASPTSAYSVYSAEALLRLQPDAIVTDSEVNLSSVLENEPWRSLRAVENHRVYTLSNAALLERPGPRYNDGLRWLITRLEPLGR